jgi:uncharacterized membrane protein
MLYAITDNAAQIADPHPKKTVKIVNFLFTSSNIPAAPAYGLYILQLVSYS